MLCLAFLSASRHRVETTSPRTLILRVNAVSLPSHHSICSLRCRDDVVRCTSVLSTEQAGQPPDRSMLLLLLALTARRMLAYQSRRARFHAWLSGSIRCECSRSFCAEDGTGSTCGKFTANAMTGTRMVLYRTMWKTCSLMSIEARQETWQIDTRRFLQLTTW